MNIISTNFLSLALNLLSPCVHVDVQLVGVCAVVKLARTHLARNQLRSPQTINDISNQL
jgi:hypothetical protein